MYVERTFGLLIIAFESVFIAWSHYIVSVSLSTFALMVLLKEAHQITLSQFTENGPKYYLKL